MARKKAPRRKASGAARTARKRSLEAVGAFPAEHFDDRLQLELRRAERYFVFLSLLLADCDVAEFKGGRWRRRKGRDHVPDIGAALKANTRDIDTLFVYEKDKMAFILPETNDEGAFEAAQRLRRIVEATKFPRFGKNFRIRVAFGVSSFPSDARTKTQLLTRAQKGLKVAVKEMFHKLPEHPPSRH